MPRGTVKSGEPTAAIAPIPPAADKAAATPVIDAAVIDGLRALDRGKGASRLARAVSRFVEIAPPLIATIRQSCDDDDAEALWRAAHSLKSSAGALGAGQLSQRCGEIEALARNTGTEPARHLVASLEFALTAAIDGLESALGEMRVPA
jgi:HPt (histidine-containing phosphotransfer) domain-containing protein